MQAILSSSQNIKKSIVYELLQPWFGTGLLTSTGILPTLILYIVYTKIFTSELSFIRKIL